MKVNEIKEILKTVIFMCINNVYRASRSRNPWDQKGIVLHLSPNNLQPRLASMPNPFPCEASSDQYQLILQSNNMLVFLSALPDFHSQSVACHVKHLDTEHIHPATVCFNHISSKGQYHCGFKNIVHCWFPDDVSYCSDPLIPFIVTMMIYDIFPFFCICHIRQ